MTDGILANSRRGSAIEVRVCERVSPAMKEWEGGAIATRAHEDTRRHRTAARVLMSSGHLPIIPRYAWPGAGPPPRCREPTVGSTRRPMSRGHGHDREGRGA